MMFCSSLRTGALLTLACALAACTAQPGGLPAAVPSASAAAPSTAPTAAQASPSSSASPAAAGETEGCEHMAAGPAKAATATLEATGRGVVAMDHHRYDVALAPQGGQYAGSVTFNSAKAGDLVVYVGFEGAASESLPLALFQDGKAIDFESSDTRAAHAACPAIKHKHVAEVGVGPVELRFGPTATAKASLVLEAGSHDDHGDDHGDDHDHK